MLAKRFGDTYTKLMTRSVGRHLAYIVTDELHRIAPIAHERAMALMGLGGATIDDCDKIRSYDDAVLAFLVGVFRYDALFYYSHW